MTDKINVAVFISGRGSNLKVLIETCGADFPAEIVLVVSDREAPGLKYAHDAGIRAETFPASDRKEFARMVQPVLDALNIDLIVLAGFMRVLDAEFVKEWPERIINIHPSLLPAFPGLHAQQQALDAGVRNSGCTIHYVVPEVDAGPVILQYIVPVEPDDTVETLSTRIQIIEHQLYPVALLLVAEKTLKEQSIGVN